MEVASAAAPHSLQVAQSRDGRDDRVGTVGQDDVIGRVAHSVDVDDTRTGQPAGAAQQVDLVLGQPAHLTGVGVVRDLEVTPCEHRLDVHLGTRGGFVRPVHRLAGTQQRLRGNARPVGALSPHQLALDDGDAQSTFRQGSRAVLSRRAAAEHNDVVVAAHRVFSLTGRGAVS